MKYKNGVYTSVTKMFQNKIKHLSFSNEIINAIAVADTLSLTIANKEVLITAGFDGKHMSGSKHYNGDAFDIRILYNYYTDAQIKSMCTNLAKNLGPSFSIILHKSHIHIQFNRK